MDDETAQSDKPGTPAPTPTTPATPAAPPIVFPVVDTIAQPKPHDPFRDFPTDRRRMGGVP